MRIARSVVCSVVAGLIASAAAASGGLDAIASADRLERSQLIAAVLERNPSIAAARHAWRAAAERPAQVAALDDLMVSYGVAPLSIASSAVDLGQELEIAQALPYAGRRRLRAGIAAAEADAMLGDLDTLRLELARRAALLHADYVLVHEALRIVGEHASLLEDLKRAATDRYAAGLASQQDPLQAESELAHLLHDDVVLRTERENLIARINTLLHREPDAALPPPAAFDVAPQAPASARPAGVAPAAEALASRPELRARAASTRARETELALARLAGRPELGVMTSYSSMWSDREHRFMVGGSLRLPVWRSRVRAGIAEAEERLAQARSELAAAEDEIRGEVHQAEQRVRESHHILDLYQSRLLPVARDRVQAAFAGFQSGRNDFLAVIEAERNQRGVELDHQRALADLARHRVELERALGRGTIDGSDETETEPGASGSGDQP